MTMASVTTTRRVLLALVPLSVGVRVQAQPAPLIVIDGGTLIDGNGGPPVPDALIIIRGSRIDLVSQKGRTAIPTGATVIQADGKFILPRLIDAHLHYSGFLAELLLAHGITTAFDISGRNLYQVVQRDAIARGRLVGPRLFVPVDSILAPTQPGGVAYGREGPRGALTVEQAMVANNVHLELDLVAEGRGLHLQSEVWHRQDAALLSNPDLAYIPEGVRAKWLANYTEFSTWSVADRAMLAKGYENYQKFAGWFVAAGGKVMAVSTPVES